MRYMEGPHDAMPLFLASFDSFTEQINFMRQFPALQGLAPKLSPLVE